MYPTSVTVFYFIIIKKFPDSTTQTIQHLKKLLTKICAIKKLKDCCAELTSAFYKRISISIPRYIHPNLEPTSLDIKAPSASYLLFVIKI
jgi:hypothetical protein